MAKYQGAYPTVKTRCTHAEMIADMKAYAKKIAADDSYHYVNWKSGDKKTHECPICHNHPKGKYRGWNCIGFSWSVWHHGAGLSSKCNCSVISNEVGEKIYKASDAKALQMAQSRIGLKDIKVIRNGRKAIPQSKLKAGDVCLVFSGDTYLHSVFYMGDGKMADCTSGKTQISIRKMMSVKVAFRYTGKSPKFRNYIKIGDSGEEVKKLQKFLNWAIGSKLTVDGEFGEKTEQAVKQFQKKCNITADGWFGEASLKRAQAFDDGKSATVEVKPVEPVITPTPTPVVAEKKGYSGEFPSMKLVKTNAEVIADTIRWALWIAGDNDFHYGYTSKDKKINAHHNGCYFCGTNTKLKSAKIKDRKRTYCCNPFVGAAWAHGGCVPKALELCQHCSSWDFNKGKGYDKSKLFTNLGHPSKSKLKAGDVLCRDTHVALYIGNGKIVQAGGGDDNKKGSAKWNKSISVATLTDANYKRFPRVHRFNSSVNTTSPLRHGEVSKRVKQLQMFLNWYNGKDVVTTDGIFGDNTWKYVKAFQTAQKLAVDGVVGENTIAKMKAVKK